MRSTEKLFSVGIVVGALLTLGPLLGLLGTVYGMMRSFNALQGPGISDPRALSHSLGLTLCSTATGLFLCPVGAAVLVLSLAWRARARRGTPPPLPLSAPP